MEEMATVIFERYNDCACSGGEAEADEEEDSY